MHFTRHLMKDWPRLMAQRKEIAAPLIADVQEVGKSASDEQSDAAAFALQQCICGPRRRDAQFERGEGLAGRRVG